VAASESGKAASVVTCLVLEEDVMLGLSAEMRHRVVEGGTGGAEARSEREGGCKAQKSLNCRPSQTTIKGKRVTTNRAVVGVEEDKG
jgi:hypothetical protein